MANGTRTTPQPAVNPSTNLMDASMQWASRPDDQRYLTVDSLEASVLARREQSWTVTPPTGSLRVLPDGKNLTVQVYDPTNGETRGLKPTNWAFGQLAQYAQAPASYLRKLPSELAAINLQYGLERMPLREDSLVLAQSNGDNIFRSMTSTSYGRIWDIDVVRAVKKVNGDGRWVIPSASYSTTNPKRATTLYASDRDVFIFLVDPKNAIEVNGETLFRGFFTWNSEVGSATFGLSCFLYRYVCDNRIIWGATQVKELRIRHTGGAPDRFAYEGEKYLARYAEESTADLVQGIKRAKETAIPVKKDETVADWLVSRGFTKGVAKAAVETAVAEEGEARSIWDIVNGITAYARSIPNTDARVEVETAAGKILDAVIVEK